MASKQGSTYRQHEALLDNGLRLTAIRTPHLHHATVALFVRVGSRHEAPEDNGLSHLVEHMFFRGCEGFGDATALNVAMEDLGGILDGYTTRDYTAYLSTVHPSHLEEALSIYGAMFSRPYFKGLEVEQQIILQEQLDSLDERGRDLDIDNLNHRLSFGPHPLAQSIEGPKKNIRRFSRDDLLRHKRRFYGARNMVLAVAGPFEPAHLKAAVARSFSALLKGRAVSDGRAPSSQDELRFKQLHSDDAQSRVRLSFRAAAAASQDELLLSALRRVLDGGLSAPLQVELVEKRGIVYEVGADYEAYSDAGLFSVEFAVGHRKLPYALRELGRVLARLRDEPIGEQELLRIKRRSAVNLDFGLDSTADLVQWFGPPRLLGRRVDPKARLARLNKVTQEDLQDVARRYLKPAQLSVGVVGGASDKRIAEAKRALGQLCERLGLGSPASARVGGRLVVFHPAIRAQPLLVEPGDARLLLLWDVFAGDPPELDVDGSVHELAVEEVRQGAHALKAHVGAEDDVQPAVGLVEQGHRAGQAGRQEVFQLSGVRELGGVARLDLLEHPGLPALREAGPLWKDQHKLPLAQPVDLRPQLRDRAGGVDRAPAHEGVRDAAADQIDRRVVQELVLEDHPQPAAGEAARQDRVRHHRVGEARVADHHQIGRALGLLQALALQLHAEEAHREVKQAGEEAVLHLVVRGEEGLGPRATVAPTEQNPEHDVQLKAEIEAGEDEDAGRRAAHLRPDEIDDKREHQEQRGERKIQERHEDIGGDADQATLEALGPRLGGQREVGVRHRRIMDARRRAAKQFERPRAPSPLAGLTEARSECSVRL